ncbi:hypothetical protein CCL23_27880 [Pseudomonas syringae]|nr:hypothetical protein CCL10_22585 [Pseudomonas syringae]PBQ01798.1 hypothetical protein CCL23_27880 [Pseudomonas syringae]
MRLQYQGQSIQDSSFDVCFQELKQVLRDSVLRDFPCVEAFFIKNFVGSFLLLSNEFLYEVFVMSS